MLENRKKLYIKYKELIDYVIYGAFTSIVNLGIKYLLFFTILDASNAFELQLAIVISWIVAVLFAYFTNRKYVFNSNNKNIFKELISFITGRLLTLLIEMFVMWFFVTLLKLNSDLQVIIFTLVAQVLVIVGNYIFSKLFVFKKEADK